MGLRERDAELLFLLAIALLATWVWWANRAKPVEVTVAVVEKGTVEKTVANTRAGTVQACRRAKLSPSAGGQIAALPVTEGQAVEPVDESVVEAVTRGTAEHRT